MAETSVQDDTIVCRMCRQSNPRVAFHKNLTGGGTYPVCKECIRKASASSQPIHPDFKSCSMCHKVQSRDAFNRHKGTKDGLAWQCKDCNSDLHSVSNSKRRTLAAGSRGTFTLTEWKALCDKYGNVCVACGAKSKLTVDHVVPLSKGGTNDISNIQPLCYSCNLAKHDRDTDYRVSEARHE